LGRIFAAEGVFSDRKNGCRWAFLGIKWTSGCPEDFLVVIQAVAQEFFVQNRSSHYRQHFYNHQMSQIPINGAIVIILGHSWFQQIHSFAAQL